MKSAKQRLMPYPEVRALEDAFGAGAAPVGLFKVLLPVWAVEIRATVTTSEPYDLIDRHLERGIAEGGLTTVAGLADFFALDAVLVDRALRFLAAIGHVTRVGDTVGLTALGMQSVRSRRRLLTSREDRRVLYFDAYRSTPLTRPYYEGRDVTLLSGAALADFLEDPENRGVFPLTSPFGFRREALAALAKCTDREFYNLPERIENPESLKEDTVYLPLYAVRCVDARAATGHRYLAYSQVGETWDEELSELLNAVPDVVGTFAAEAGELDAERVGARLREEIDPGATGPTQMPDGSWRATFTPEAFRQDALSYHRVGSYRLWGSNCFRVWCDDADVRRRALVERTNSLLAARARLTREDVEPLLDKVATQLSLSDASVEAVARLAERHHMPGLAAQLTAIDKDSGG